MRLKLVMCFILQLCLIRKDCGIWSRAKIDLVPSTLWVTRRQIADQLKSFPCRGGKGGKKEGKTERVISLMGENK